jgi:polyisoprenoid-binding protein YceI
MSDGTKRRRWRMWLVVGLGALVVAVVGGPYLYIHFIQGDAPPPLALSSPSGGPSAAGGLDGTWAVSDGSVAGYRVKEVLFGQSNVAVGRTSGLSGSITVTGTTISAAEFTADMKAVTSDETRRDEQFNGRIMDTARYPTATFTLTEPIDLDPVPAQGTDVPAGATGELTLHGVTRSVTFDVTARLAGSAARVVGQIPITFADWNIPNPSFGPVTTEDNGILEFSLDLTRG